MKFSKGHKYILIVLTFWVMVTLSICYRQFFFRDSYMKNIGNLKYKKIPHLKKKFNKLRKQKCQNPNNVNKFR